MACIGVVTRCLPHTSVIYALPLDVTVQGSIVEMLVARGEVSFIVTNPDDGAEMVWQNNATVSRPYK